MTRPWRCRQAESPWRRRRWRADPAFQRTTEAVPCRQWVVNGKTKVWKCRDSSREARRGCGEAGAGDLLTRVEREVKFIMQHAKRVMVRRDKEPALTFLIF